MYCTYIVCPEIIKPRKKIARRKQIQLKKTKITRDHEIPATVAQLQKQQLCLFACSTGLPAPSRIAVSAWCSHSRDRPNSDHAAAIKAYSLHPTNLNEIRNNLDHNKQR